MNTGLQKAIELSGGTQNSLAELLGVKQGHVYYWIKKQLPVNRAIQIEQALKGQVKREELRPDVFS